MNRSVPFSQKYLPILPPALTVKFYGYTYIVKNLYSSNYNAKVAELGENFVQQNVLAIHAIYMYVQSCTRSSMHTLVYSYILTRMYTKLTGTYYRIAGYFRGVQFSWIVNLYYFTGLIFADASTHAHYVLYVHNRTFFTGSIFTVRQSSTKTVKIGPLKNFLLYGNSVTILLSTISLHVM